MVNAAARALAHREALGAWRERGNVSMRRGGLVLLFDSAPEVVRNKDGEVAGIDVWVRAFRGAQEIKIDPHRRFFNPPTHHAGIEDPVGAFEQMLFESVEVAPNPRGWRTSGTVSTFYSTTADGRIRSLDTSYTSARSGSSLNAASAFTNFFVGQLLDVSDYTIYEGFIQFDTSSIGDSDTITDSVLALYGQEDSSDTNFTINARLYDWGATLSTTDWVAGASLSANTLLATWSTNSGWSLAGYNSFTSEAAFTSNINKTGSTRIILSSSRHEDGTAPTGNEYVGAVSADEAGTTQDPKLTVTHQRDASITGTSASSSAAANAGTVTTSRVVDVSGSIAEVSLTANPGERAVPATVAGVVAEIGASAEAGVVTAIVRATYAVGAIGSGRLVRVARGLASPVVRLGRGRGRISKPGTGKANRT